MDTDLRTYVVGLDTPANKTYINLDNAASTPPFKSVLSAVQEFAPWYASVTCGNGLKSRLSSSVYASARQIVGEFVGADPTDYVVIFGKNATEAINKLSYRLSLGKKDIVLISQLENHSNDLPWRARATVKRIGVTTEGDIDKASYVALLKKHVGKVKLVAISGASNVTGHTPDIYWFARKAHEAGATIMIDCTQLAAHRPINVGRLADPEHLDYVVLSGHKMYAPFGTGALIGRRDTFSQGAPEYRGAGTISMVTTKTVDWAVLPEKEEAGAPNVVGAIALARAIKTLESIGMQKIADHEAKLTEYALLKLREVPGLVLYGDPSPAHAANRVGVIPFVITDVPSHLVAAILGYEWGISVRSGCFCAQPYVLGLLGVDSVGEKRIRHLVMHRRRNLVPGMVRISFGLYNTRQDINRLVDALQHISKGAYGEYVVDKASGFYEPTVVQDDYSQLFKI